MLTITWAVGTQILVLMSSVNAGSVRVHAKVNIHITHVDRKLNEISACYKLMHPV